MLSGGISIASPGQFSPGAIGYPSIAGILLPAPFNRTFIVPQNGLVWQGEKTPETILNFSFNWADEIGDDLISASSWILQSSDLTQVINNIDESRTLTTVLLSDGVAANIYKVTNLITTQSGLKLDATFELFVKAYSNSCNC